MICNCPPPPQGASTLHLGRHFVQKRKAMATVYDFQLKDKKGNEVSLSDYKGKVLLIVNTATECGFTPQYDELEALYKAHRAQGLEILDIPCNQFGGQAPGSDEEIHEFCTMKFGVEFPQFKKSDVNGADELPLYTFLKQQKGFAGFDANHKLTPILEACSTRPRPIGARATISSGTSPNSSLIGRDTSWLASNPPTISKTSKSKSNSFSKLTIKD